MIGIGTHIRRRFGAPKFTFTCTTTGAQTLTVQRIDLAAGKSCVIDWGDGTSNTYDSSNNGSTKTRAYAGAGTYTVKISNPKEFTVFDLRDNKALLNSNQFKLCGSNLISLRIDKTVGTGSIVNSDDIKHLNLTSTLSLIFLMSGTYRIDTADISAMTPASTLSLYFSQSGTYRIDTADISAMTPASTLSLIFLMSGTYRIDTADISAMTPASTLYLYFSQSGTYIYNSDDLKLIKPTFENIVLLNAPTATVNRLHYSGQINIGTFRRWLALDATKVTDILLGLYDAFPSKTNTGGTINVGGFGAMANASPTGTLQRNPACGSDPTGKEAAHELVNDLCERSTKHWTSVTIN